MSISPLRSPIKYPGGKRKLIPEILQRLPVDLSLLCEPFFGGGSLGLQLAGEGKLRRLVAGEASIPVHAFWRVLTDENNPSLSGVRSQLHKIQQATMTPTLYGRIRHEMNSIVKTLDLGKTDGWTQTVAAQFLWLNHVCNNGIVRFNQAGEFNVPIGKKQDGSFHRFKPDFDHLERCQRALRGAAFQIYPTWMEALALADLADGWTPERARAGDWSVYADPPYTGGFVGYTPEGWTSDDDIKLFTALAWASDYGARVVLSQPDTEWSRDCCAQLLKGWQVDSLGVGRPVNSDGEGRGPVGELLIWNKPVELVMAQVDIDLRLRAGHPRVDTVVFDDITDPTSDDNCGLA